MDLFLKLICEELNEDPELVELNNLSGIDKKKHILLFSVGVFDYCAKLSKRNDTIVKHSIKRI